MSYLGAAMCIISTAQQARPNVNGQIEPLRPQFRTSSRRATVQSAQFDCFLKFSTSVTMNPKNQLSRSKIFDSPSEGRSWEFLRVFLLYHCHSLLVTFLLAINCRNSDCFQELSIASREHRARRNQSTANHFNCWMAYKNKLSISC